MRMLEVEKIAGKRADFHVYYRKTNGKLFVDAMWGDSEEEVTGLFTNIAKEMRWKVRIVKVVKVTP